MKITNLIGKQYKYRRNANRAIHNFIAHVNTNPEVEGNVILKVKRFAKDDYKIQGKMV